MNKNTLIVATFVFITLLMGIVGLVLGLYLAKITVDHPALGFGSLLGTMALVLIPTYGLTYSKEEYKAIEDKNADDYAGK